MRRAPREPGTCGCGTMRAARRKDAADRAATSPRSTAASCCRARPIRCGRATSTGCSSRWCRRAMTGARRRMPRRPKPGSSSPASPATAADRCWRSATCSCRRTVLRSRPATTTAYIPDPGAPAAPDRRARLSRQSIDHYVGMSHYFRLDGNAGGRFTWSAWPAACSTSPRAAWHRDFFARARRAGVRADPVAVLRTARPALLERLEAARPATGRRR